MTTVNLSSINGRVVQVAYTGPYTGAGLPSISTSDATVYPGQSRTITGVNFGEIQGSVEIDGVDQTITNWSDTSITYTCVQGSNKYSSGKTLLITTDGTLETSASVELVAEPGSSYANVSNPITDDSNSVFYQVTNTVITGDQVQWRDPNDLGSLAVSPQGLPSADSTGFFEARIWDSVDSLWGSWQTIEFAEVSADVTPDAFTVTPLTNQPLDSYVEFAPIEVTGVDAGENIPVTVTGASVEYAVDTGSGYGGFTSTSTNVQLGYFVKPRIRTATEGSTEVTGSIDIGGESSGLSATTVAAVPQSVPVIGTPTTTKNSVSASFTYSGSDATGFEARIGSGSWESVTSPLTISGLSASFTGTLEVRAVNSTGAGSADSVQFTTDALEPPVGVISFGTPSKTDSTITQPYTYSASDQTGFEQSINNGSWVSSTSPVSLSGLPEKTFVNISVRPVNDDGVGQTYTTSVQTNAAPDTTPPTISIAGVSTRDLTPTITGFCGDATSITLVVTGVGTYNPTNNQGTFSVQLPELTVGTYEMILDAEDSLGNASVQQTATLTILEPLPPRGNAFGLRDMNPSMQVVTLMSNDGGACEMDEFGRFTTTNAYSIVDVDMDGIQRKVLVKADGRPIKPFYKVNWQILD